MKGMALKFRKKMKHVFKKDGKSFNSSFIKANSTACSC